MLGREEGANLQQFTPISVVIAATATSLNRERNSRVHFLIAL
jgi:hypothetical protein